MFEAIMAIATLVTAVVGGVASYVQSEKAADSQEEANKKMRQAEMLKAQRERMNALREARMKRAQIATAGATQGVSQSSGVVGGMQSATGQGYANVGFVNSMESLTGKANDYMAQAGNYQRSAAGWGSISSAAGTIFGELGGFKTIFNTNQKSPYPAPVTDKSFYS